MWFITIFFHMKMIFLKCKGLNYYLLSQRDDSLQTWRLELDL